MMKRNLVIGLTATLAITAVPVQAQDDLVYVAVDPCRIVNTRKGLAEPVRKNDHTNFLVSGTASELFNQGGQQAGGCPSPRPEQHPAAIAAYVVAVPAESSTGPGILTAYPANLAQPPVGAGATVNFEEGKVVGNTTIISTCEYRNCPPDGQFAILARDTDEHVIIDVQGYFYPKTSDYVEVTSEPVVVSADDTSAEALAECPEDFRPIGGGGTMDEGSLSPGRDWVMVNSYPVLYMGSMPLLGGPIRGWEVEYARVGSPDEGELRAYAICTP